MSNREQYIEWLKTSLESLTPAEFLEELTGKSKLDGIEFTLGIWQKDSSMLTCYRCLSSWSKSQLAPSKKNKSIMSCPKRSCRCTTFISGG